MVASGLLALLIPTRDFTLDTKLKICTNDEYAFALYGGLPI